MKQLFNSFRFFLFAILLGSTIFSSFGQNSATINPRNYSQANPYVIPSLPNGSTFYLKIKTGKPIPAVIQFANLGTGRHGTPDGRNLVNVSTFIIDVPGTWGLTWYQSGAERSIACIVNYQVDIQDQTNGSATYRNYPDFIWVTQGGIATASSGSIFAVHEWSCIDGVRVIISNNYVSDSTKTLTFGNYEMHTMDATANNYSESRDTISILEKPTFNSTAKTLNFPTTTTGITYKLLKASSISGTDTTWTETQNFVGDGNAKNITLTDGKYKLTTTLGIHTAVYPYGYFVVSSPLGHATIDPRNYSQVNPYVIPNLPDKSLINLSIKTGKSVYITNSGMDINSYIVLTPDGKTLYGSSFLCNLPGHWQLNFNTISNPKTIELYVNYQADLQDQTIGSATYGNYPDFIWVTQGSSAQVSAGRNFVLYGWLDMHGNYFSTSETDSTKTFTFGSYVSHTMDKTFNDNSESSDTISILEKPTFNSTAKTLNFPTTTTGITYKLLKASSISGTDTTWTETQNFVGDGNAKNITLTDGKYKLTTTLGIHTAVYPYGYFDVGEATALDKTKEGNINYRLVDNKLQFDNEVNLKFYSLEGQLLQQGKGSSFKLCRQMGIFKAIDRNGNVLTTKIILK
ncbi:MAG: hypothetical protein ACOYOT_06110 [Bacteroidales bacterium]